MPTDEEIKVWWENGVDELTKILKKNRVVALPDYDTLKEWNAKRFGIGKDSALFYQWELIETLLDKGSL